MKVDVSSNANFLRKFDVSSNANFLRKFDIFLIFIQSLKDIVEEFATPETVDDIMRDICRYRLISKNAKNIVDRFFKGWTLKYVNSVVKLCNLHTNETKIFYTSIFFGKYIRNYAVIQIFDSKDANRHDSTRVEYTNYKKDIDWSKKIIWVKIYRMYPDKSRCVEEAREYHGGRLERHLRHELFRGKTEDVYEDYYFLPDPSAPNGRLYYVATVKYRPLICTTFPTTVENHSEKINGKNSIFDPPYGVKFMDFYKDLF